MRGAGALGLAGRRLLDALLPPRCLRCADAVSGAGLVCGACWAQLRFVAPPCCRQCGRPFEFDPGALDPGVGARCADCHAAPPPYERARSALAYDDASRPMILAFKHADRTEAAPSFARWMRSAAAELLAEAEVIAPVPLHRWRLLHRRYNQAALLARELGRETGAAVIGDLLQRRRNTPSQGRLSATQRRRNVAGAFSLTPRHLARVAGRRVLLVDDVMTTGATAAACATVLCRAGARAVDVVTLARVFR